MFNTEALSKKIQSGLRPSGFCLSYQDETEVVVFSTSSGKLFHRIRVSLFPDRESASAGVELAIVPGRTALKSLCIHKCLMQAADGADGIAKIKHANQQDLFIDRLAAFGPDQCIQLEFERGAELRTTTKSARLACARYLERMRPKELSPSDAPDALTLREMDRILSARIQCLPNSKELYRQVVQVIVEECDLVEGMVGWIKNRQADSATDRELMIRIQILASILSNEPGSDKIDLSA